MGGINSKTLSCYGLIKLINETNAHKYICDEHDQIMNMEVPGTLDVSMAAENLKKNRYSDAPCFDHNRVILQEDEKCGGYINASFVDGFNHPKKYIVSQAPLETTTSDWWKMIWEQKIELIVMLCKLVENEESQCYSYWSPVEGTTLKFGNLKVNTIKVDSTLENIRITSIVVTHKNGDHLKLTHFLYEKWQEHDISPVESDFLDLVLLIKTYDLWALPKKSVNGQKTDSSSPILVHCNNGLGRSMTFCAVDILLSRFVKTGKVNPYSTVLNLRMQRYNCLSDINQYFFCYTVLFYYFTVYSTLC
uniref:Protein tyrosine phosphatase n=1 Tax=Glyptapanteles flavicoxis TaxID=463051 RepID=B7S8J5_9HYME|nr:protein tyrosine phosphatase [Glyptapanteles flavicoxis]